MSEPEDRSLVDQSGSKAARINTKGFAHISSTAAFESDLRRLNLTELYLLAVDQLLILGRNRKDARGIG